MPHDNRGRASLWPAKSGNTKAPAYSGNVVAHRDIQEGEELDLAFWENDSDNPKAPKYRGQMRDKREQKSQVGSGPGGDADDDVPF